MVGCGIASTSGGAEARRASSLWVPAGPRYATRMSGARGRTCHRGLDRLLLLGRELVLGVALAHLLHVQARLVAVEDRRDHDAGAPLVEQGDRARLLPRQLVHRVVAHDRRVRDAA